MWSSPAVLRGRTPPFQGPLHISNKSTFRQRYADTLADDDVIEQPNVHQGERLLDALRDQFVGLARLGDAGGVLGFIRTRYSYFWIRGASLDSPVSAVHGTAGYGRDCSQGRVTSS